MVSTGAGFALVGADLAMTVALAPLPRVSLCWPMAQRSWAEVGRRGDQQPSRLVRLATAGVAANSALLLLVALYRVAAFPLEPGHTIQVLVATACVLPPTVWLVLSAARNTRPRGRGWALAGVAAVTLGGLPVIGADWLGGAFATLAALVLIVIRPPWSFLLFAGLAATPWPVGVAFGRPDVGLYETAVLLLNAPPLALLVWLIAKTRELQAARLALAEEAVVRERLNIDDELRRTLGTALEDIAARADRSTDLALRDHAEAARVLGALVEDSRGTLAE